MLSARDFIKRSALNPKNSGCLKTRSRDGGLLQFRFQLEVGRRFNLSTVGMTRAEGFDDP